MKKTGKIKIFTRWSILLIPKTRKKENQKNQKIKKSKIWKIQKFKIFTRGAWPHVMKTRKTKILITLFSQLWNPCSTCSKQGNRYYGHKKDTISWWSSSWSFCKQPAVSFVNLFTFYLTTYFRIWKPLWIPTMDFSFHPCGIQCKYPWYFTDSVNTLGSIFGHGVNTPVESGVNTFVISLQCKYLRYFTSV